MTEKYSELSSEKLREMLLLGQLEHRFMTQEDYSAIIDDELEMTEPNMEVLEFCTEGLYQFDEYKALENVHIDIDKLFNSVVSENIQIKRRSARKFVVVAAAVIAATLAVQLTAMALGYDLLGYIFKWGEEEIIIDAPPNELSTDAPDLRFFENADELPKELKQYISAHIFENYQLSEAVYMQENDIFFFTLHFVKDDDISLTMMINKQVNAMMIEKDDEVFEEYEKNGIVYTIFKNLDFHKVLWVRDGIVYDLGVNLPIDEVRAIIDSYY